MEEFEESMHTINSVVPDVPEFEALGVTERVYVVHASTTLQQEKRSN